MKTHHKPVIMLDLSGVYLTKGVEIAAKKISKKYKIPEKNVLKVLKGSIVKKYRQRKLSATEFWKAISKQLKVSKKELKKIELMWHSSYKPQKDVQQFVKKLRKKYRVSILSDNLPERVVYLHKKYKILDDFHYHHFSFDHGFTKEDVRLFKLAAKKMHLKPEDCIAVDDKKEFLDKVKKTGAKTILFKNAKQLEAQLRRYGVKI